MKEYILKKDLPFAKAGEKITFIGSSLTEKDITIEVDPKYKLRIWITGEGMKRLIDEDWVKEVVEVKPREWYLLKSFGGQIVDAIEEELKLPLAGVKEIIHVQEIPPK